MNRVEKLKIALHKMQNEREELRGILSYYPSEDFNNRINFESEMLMMQHQEVMTDLQKMPQQICETLYKTNQLTKENQCYCLRYCLLLTESIQLKQKAKRARIDNRELLLDQIALEESIKETARFCVEASMKISEASNKQHQDEDRLEERLQDPLKQKELVTDQKDLAQKMRCL